MALRQADGEHARLTVLADGGTVGGGSTWVLAKHQAAHSAAAQARLQEAERAHRVKAVQQLAAAAAAGAAPQAQAAVLAARGQQVAALRPAQRVDRARVASQGCNLLQAAGQACVAQRGREEAVRAVAKGGAALQRRQRALPLQKRRQHGAVSRSAGPPLGKELGGRLLLGGCTVVHLGACPATSDTLKVSEDADGGLEPGAARGGRPAGEPRAARRACRGLGTPFTASQRRPGSCPLAASRPRNAPSHRSLCPIDALRLHTNARRWATSIPWTRGGGPGCCSWEAPPPLPPQLGSPQPVRRPPSCSALPRYHACGCGSGRWQRRMPACGATCRRCWLAPRHSTESCR